MRLSLSDVAKIVGAEAPTETAEITGIAVDSRKVKPGDLFCAVEGASLDGHDYIGEAAAHGAAAALVTRPVLGYLPVLQVNSVSESLLKIAGHIRSSFDGPVVAITGSVGKTTVRELVATALSSAGPVLKSEGNQNTEYGLPMTLIGLTDVHKFCVLEMGMRGLGQIGELCVAAHPTIGVVTKIGTAHIGELGGRAAIAKAKAELIESLPTNGVAILPADDDFIAELKAAAKCKTLTFGIGEANAKVVVHSTDFVAGTVHYETSVGNQMVSGVVPGLGEQQAVNASAALAVCLALDLDVELAAKEMSKAILAANRLSLIHLSGTVLSDVYNSSPESCIESLRVLAQFPAEGERIAVLGDMLELGSYSEEGHRRVGAEVARLRIDRLAVIGRDSHWIRDEAIERGFEGRVDSLGTVENVASLIRGLRDDDVLLIKASRGLALERAIELAEAAHA